jgi:hypothetical protein
MDQTLGDDSALVVVARLQDHQVVTVDEAVTFLSSFNGHLVGDQQYLVDGFSEATPPRDWPMSEASRSRCDPGSKSS